MKHLIIALALLPANAALSEPLTIAAGKPTGGYDKAAQSLSQRLSQRSIWFPPGSLNNELEDLDDTSTILIDTIGSGTDLFWHTIRKIETDPKTGNSSAYEIRSYLVAGPAFDASLTRTIQGAIK